MGGGGGGAGGGGAWSFEKRFFFHRPKNEGSSWWIGRCRWPWWSFRRGGGRGGRGGRGNVKNLFGAGPSQGGPSKGSSGGSGDSIGAAIAIWNGQTRRLSRQNISSNLSLDNVSFYNNVANRREVFSDTGNPISINIIFDGSGRDSRTPVTPSATVLEVLFVLQNLPPQRIILQFSMACLCLGLHPWQTLVIQFYRPLILQISSILVLNRSTVAGITTDLTNEDNPLNKIWKELVPDNSSEILRNINPRRIKVIAMQCLQLNVETRF